MKSSTGQPTNSSNNSGKHMLALASSTSEIEVRDSYPRQTGVKSRTFVIPICSTAEYIALAARQSKKARRSSDRLIAKSVKCSHSTVAEARLVFEVDGIMKPHESQGDRFLPRRASIRVRPRAKSDDDKLKRPLTNHQKEWSRSRTRPAGRLVEL